MIKLHRYLAAVAIAAVLSACGEEEVAPVTAPVVRPKPVVVAVTGDGGVPAEVVQYSYSYNPVGKRDPFRSPIGEKAAAGLGAEASVEVCPEPLCAFDLEQLILVAVVSGDANPVAMLESPDKVGHIVRRNTKVGKQGGKVTQILRDCVVITEYFMTPDGKKNPNRVNICVKKEDARDRTFDLFNNKNVE